jgi:hypothetical protein
VELRFGKLEGGARLELVVTRPDLRQDELPAALRVAEYWRPPNKDHGFFGSKRVDNPSKEDLGDSTPSQGSYQLVGQTSNCLQGVEQEVEFTGSSGLRASVVRGGLRCIL